MTLDELALAISTVIPRYAFEVDNYGQLIIYTDMMLDGRELVPFVEE